MKGHLRYLLKPAATSSTDSLKWTDKRSIGAQVAGGFRKAGALIGGFAVMVGCLGGLAAISDHDAVPSERASLVAWAALLIGTMIMLWTANRWAPFVTGFFFGPAVLKIAAALFVGSDIYYSAHSISRVDLAEFLAYALAVVALTSRFVGKHPAPTTLLDRFALTFFVLATFQQVVIRYRFPPWPLLLGAVGLIIAWSVHRINRIADRKHMKRQPPRSARSCRLESVSIRDE